MRTLSFWTLSSSLMAVLFTAEALVAQKAPDPEVAYVFPPGAQRGQSVDVRLAGFDWTPDLEFFVLDPRVILTIDGQLSRHLMPEPPYPVGMRAYRPPGLPREISAQVSIPSDLPTGPVRWQIANANGASNTGVFIVSDSPEVIENRDGNEKQRLESIPITVSGRISRFEEIDSYEIQPARNGLVTCDLQARHLGSNFNGVLEVRDETERLVTDAVDTEGVDVSATWFAEAGKRYCIFVRDLNFRGNRAYVYRLSISDGPRILAAIPAAGQRGTTTNVELVGFGLATERRELERITRTISFPNDPEQTIFNWQSTIDSGQPLEFQFPLSDVPEAANSLADGRLIQSLSVPSAVTGNLSRLHTNDRYQFTAPEGERIDIAVQSRGIGSPLDVSLSICDANGKELATNDDLPETTDAGLEFSVPAKGTYEIVVTDVSGANPSPLNLYHLAITPAQPDFRLQVQQHINIPIGEKVEIPLKVIRTGGFQSPISLAVSGLPQGISTSTDLVIAPDQSELKVPLQSTATTPSGASFVTITGTASIADRTLSHRTQAIAAGNLAPRDPAELVVESILVASTMKPVTKIRPIETDERTIHRGTVHLAELAIERLPPFEGEVIIQMDSRQPAKFRQGILGPDVTLPVGSNRMMFPCLVPEVAETVDAYRFLLVAVAQVPDPQGRIRYLLSKMQADDASVAITVEGALLRISTDIRGLSVHRNETISVPVKIARSPKLMAPVRLDIRVPDELTEFVHVKPLIVPPEQQDAVLQITTGSNARPSGTQKMTIRAIALQPGNPATISDTAQATPMDVELLAILKSGMLPVIAEKQVSLELLDDQPRSE